MCLRCKGSIEIVYALEAVAGLFGEAAEDDARQFQRDVASEICQRFGTFVGVGEEHLNCAAADEGGTAREHEVSERTDAVEVAAPVHLSRTSCLLGGHVIGRSQGEVGGGEGGLIG